MTKVGLFQFILLFLISSAFGQKAKYKDIYALLIAKQYEQAEPFLKNYLLENNDNPNAFLFMGNIFQEKSFKNDILKQTTLAIANMDSAILYYRMAHQSLDDREIRRNQEYYKPYSRRDLRTGEFGVKLSDVQFDIEKKIESLSERIDLVTRVNHYFALADTAYHSAHHLFISLQENYPSVRQLHLRATEKTVKDLSTLAVRFDSSMKAFENYQRSLSALGKTGYKQTLRIAGISDFKKEGVELADLSQDNPKIWDYKGFADTTRQVIEKVIFPMRENLLSFDQEINKLREKMTRDSFSVRSELTKFMDKILYDQFKQVDPEPLPMIVLDLKVADLGYHSVLLEHAPFRDSADIAFQISMVEKEISLLQKLDSLSEKISAMNVDEKALDYDHFIKNAYSNTTVLKSYLRTQREYGEREHRKKIATHTRLVNSLRYIVDGADSIPLSFEITRPHKTLFTSDEKFTTGLYFPDPLHVRGYFYTITASRIPEMKALFPVNKFSFSPEKLSETKALAYSDEARQIYYVLVYSTKSVKEKFPATLAKISRSDGLAWSLDYQLTFVPSDLSVTMDTGELIIRNSVQNLVVDKSGKVIQ